MMRLLPILIVCMFATSADAKYSVRRNTNMAFGTIASSNDGGGTATISTGSDTKTVTSPLYDMGGAVTRAQFTIKDATPNGNVTITLPASFTVSKSGVTLTVDDLQTNVGLNPQVDGAGGLVFFVSGRLNVGIGQAGQSGLTGSFLVDVVDDTSGDQGDASANGSASIAAPIAISATTSLNFGTLASPSVSATQTISTSGASTPVNVTETAGSVFSEGVFDVTGESGASFSVTLPTSMTISNGTQTMTVDGFNHDAGASPALGGGGSRTLSIGATLNLNANQAGGSYTGSYSVSVNYN